MHRKAHADENTACKCTTQSYPGAVEGLGVRALEGSPADVLGGHGGALVDAVVVELHLRTIGGDP